MSTRTSLATLVAMAGLLASPAQAITWHVDADGGGDAPTIQAAIDAAAPGDTVLASAGRYYESLRLHGKAITVASWYLTTGQESYIDETILDGTNHSATSPVRCLDGETRATLVCGFTIEHGNGTVYAWHFGGGVFVFNASPTLRHLKIRDCEVFDYYGGGIGVLGYSSPLFEHLLVEGCSAPEGGAIHLEGADHPDGVIVRDAVLVNNEGALGAAINLYGDSRLRLERVVMADNVGYEAAVMIQGGDLVMVDSTIGIHPQGGVGLWLGRAVLVNSVIWGPTASPLTVWGRWGPARSVVAHCDLAGGLDGVTVDGEGTLEWLDGNLDLDPRFVDPAGHDYRLQEDSPCIDAGTATLEVDGELVVDLRPGDYCGDAPDQGAHEYCVVTGVATTPTATATLSAAPNPLNPATVIRYTVSAAGPVRLTIHDIAGRRVATLVEGNRDAGEHVATWRGRDASGRPLPSGVYLLRLVTGGEVVGGRLTLAL